MSENQPLPVPGYTPQSDDNVALVRKAKELEERVLRHIDDLETRPGVDAEMVRIGRFVLQDAFMWLNRAVFQPSRIKLPEDGQ